MAEEVSDTEAVKPPPKRRRILDPSTIVPVSVYSNKVSNSLQLKQSASMLAKKEAKDDTTDQISWSQFSARGPTTTAAILLSDSEEEAERVAKRTELEAARCASPSPPGSPVQKHSRMFQKKIGELNRMLQSVNSFLCPELQNRKTHCQVTAPSHNDDIIVVTPPTSVVDCPYSSSVREIPLKVRCLTDVHRIPVLSSTPLSDVVTRLSAILDVPLHRLLLLKDEAELQTDATVGELNLGITDIIECAIMAAEDGRDVITKDITVRLQSKDKHSSQEFTLSRDAPLGSVFSQYLSRMSRHARKTARFQFDGSCVMRSQTPAQLNMEDGDVIEVWV